MLLIMELTISSNNAIRWGLNLTLMEVGPKQELIKEQIKMIAQMMKIILMWMTVMKIITITSKTTILRVQLMVVVRQTPKEEHNKIAQDIAIIIHFSFSPSNRPVSLINLNRIL